MIHPYLRTRVGYVLCTTYVQPGISSYVPGGISRLPRYVYVYSYEPGLHLPPKKEQNAQHTYQHVCTWYQPTPKRLMYQGHIPPKKRTEGLLMKLLQKNKIKINNRNTELCHHRPRAKRTATSTRTTQTRQNNTYRLGAAPAGVVGARSRCYPAATVPAAVVFACQETCGPHGRAYEFRQDRQPWKIIHDEG